MGNASSRFSLDERAQKALTKKRAYYSSWAAVSEELGGVNKGYLNSVARGKKRASNALLIALKLPPRDAVVPVCQKCGKPHEMLKKCGPRKARGKSNPQVSLYWRKDKPLSLGQYVSELSDWLSANAAELARRVKWAEWQTIPKGKP